MFRADARTMMIEIGAPGGKEQLAALLVRDGRVGQQFPGKEGFRALSGIKSHFPATCLRAEA